MMFYFTDTMTVKDQQRIGKRFADAGFFFDALIRVK